MTSLSNNATSVPIKNPITTAVVELAQFIEADTSLQQALANEDQTLTVRTEWPANGSFQEPSITVLAPTTRFIRHFPKEIAYNDDIDGRADIGNALRNTRYRLGELAISLDLHVYAKSLRQRGMVEAALFNILEGYTGLDDFPHTLRIQSEEYYQEYIRYHLSTDVYRDNEVSQTQSQYVSIVGVNCDMDWVVSKKEYEINKVFLHTCVSPEDLSNQQVEEEIFVIE